MKDADRTREQRRGQPPIAAYALILGILVIAAIVVGAAYGRANQNPISSGAPASGTTGKH